MHLAERAGSHGEVLAEGGHGAPADIAGPDHDAVGGQFLLLRDARLARAADVHADLLEGAFLEQRVEAFAGGQPALLVAGAGLVLAAAGENLGLSVPQFLRILALSVMWGLPFQSGRAGPVRSAAAPAGSR